MQSITGVSIADELPADGEPPVVGDGAGTGRLGDRLFGGAAVGSGLIVVALVTLIGVFLLSQALPALAKNEANFFTSTEWAVSGDHPRFGIARLLWVTVLSSLMALSIAVPLGVAVALFLTQYAPRWLARPAAATVDLLAAVPSIVFGLWGLRVLGPMTSGLQDFLRNNLGFIPIFSTTSVGSVTTVFLAGLVLSIMILPIVTALSREVFAQTPGTHKEGALALGATKWEMIRTAVLPFGKPGVISASMLGLGRALGETVAVMMLISSLPGGADWSWSLFGGGETFASKIALGAGEFDSPQKTGAYIAAGLVLFILTFVVNAIARVVIERRKAFTE
ncbi:MAG TPA: phosphate ABC transporter permease subunit PstC [Tetrasphaera sp.]|uniref:phosphate ABC transporter permease subunit PstC n=1 Tax=Nostocoides sp. TaxID=1917966 RepID=UPI002C532132|nr:phosphate ABC transporter permease subunit PstC [Tetrasphaera sp.]HNQ06982.1 phosphate ABC transporter permease subunit PstC [Tetrasphaera sp.]